jgi:transposase
MASSSGTPVSAIARLVAADEDTVRDVIHAFNEKGLAALGPRWAGGRPRLISDDDIAFIARDGHHPTHQTRVPLHALEPAQTRRSSGPLPRTPDRDQP